MSTFIDGNLDRSRALYLLTMQDAALRGMAETFPEPRWIKFWHDGDALATMVWMNQAYAHTFGLDGYRYIGHCDRIAWPDDVAAEFARNDRAAIDHPNTIMTAREPTPRGPSPFTVVRKFAFRVDTDDLHGWAVYGECSAEH